MSSATLSAWVNTTLTALGARLFRNAVGMAWVGKVKEMVRDGKPAVLILEATHLPFGLIVPSAKPAKGKKKSTSGGSDKIGWTPVLVTPEHVGQTLAVFTAVEEKSLAYPMLTPDQRNFLDQVVKAGGLGYVARETAEGPRLVQWPEPIKPRKRKG